jgi:hypothetical protein
VKEACFNKLVTGMTVGTWVHMLLLGAVVVGTTNWEAEAKKAKERVGVGSTHESPARKRRLSEDAVNAVEIFSV